VLFTVEDHYFTGKENLGIGTNNQGEFRALFFLLKCALEKNIMQLQVFGDSVMTIKWMNNEIQVHSTGLSQLALHLKDISGLFQMISFTHI
jgi:ribonuclease HI